MFLFALESEGATLTIVNGDGAGEGFNDPTPVTPVGGNTGTTLGEQRLIAFQTAADIWGMTLQSTVTIRVQASFDPLFCNPSSAVLGAAGATFLMTDFDGIPSPNTFYPIALANALAGADLLPGSDDIGATFNGSIDNNNSCLTGTNWYLGLDHQGPGIDLLAVLLHELGHGLGFASYVDESTGMESGGLPDIWSFFMLDNSSGLHWNAMSDSQRQSSAINTGNLVWDGPSVTFAAPGVLDPSPVLLINSPGGIAGTYAVQSAAFGPPLDLVGATANVVLAIDAVGATNDGCQALTNSGQVSGAIALVDRGSCNFTVKVANAQTAGAIGVLVANNVATGLPPMGGSDPTITIPSVGISGRRNTDQKQSSRRQCDHSPGPDRSPRNRSTRARAALCASHGRARCRWRWVSRGVLVAVAVGEGDGATPTQTPTITPTPNVTATPTATPAGPTPTATATQTPGPEPSCVRNSQRACLLDSRFAVEVEMHDFSDPPPGGNLFPGMIQIFDGVSSETDQAVAFYSFEEGNVEVYVKMVDACSSGFNSFWVFAFGGTTAQVRLVITDTYTDEVYIIENPSRRTFVTTADTEAFLTCDAPPP